MANPEHVKIVRQGAKAIRQWRDTQPDPTLNLSIEDLSGSDLRGADISRANLEEANLTGAKLSGANLSQANLEKANLSQASLETANLTGANLSRANLSHANLTLANLSHANLSGATIFMANLDRATLASAHLRDSQISAATLTKVELTGADLSGSDLMKADLSGSTLNDSQLQSARFLETNLSGASLAKVKGSERARNLETVVIRDHRDVQYFDRCVRKWPEKLLDWERFRTIGRLPLFTASYAVLILIPIFFYGLAFYNNKVDLLQAWAGQVLETPGSQWHSVAVIVKDKIHPLPIPSRSFLLLVSTVLLAAGSSIYTFACPSRIKEFSRDQWCDQLGRSLIHYWPLAWKHRLLRLICAVCYAVGGAGVLYVIITKVWRVTLFIIENSQLPWHQM